MAGTVQAVFRTRVYCVGLASQVGRPVCLLYKPVEMFARPVGRVTGIVDRVYNLDWVHFPTLGVVCSHIYLMRNDTSGEKTRSDWGEGFGRTISVAI